MNHFIKVCKGFACFLTEKLRVSKIIIIVSSVTDTPQDRCTYSLKIGNHIVVGSAPPPIIWLAISSHLSSTQLSTYHQCFRLLFSIQSAVHKEFTKLSVYTGTPKQHFRSTIVASTSKINFCRSNVVFD